ncbi:hypothetical protein TNCV_724281 [Trichonephila clavipes]|nr:hypothetical protein TNCV_724281 [Trichonephila clavipes]
MKCGNTRVNIGQIVQNYLWRITEGETETFTDDVSMPQICEPVSMSIKLVHVPCGDQVYSVYRFSSNNDTKLLFSPKIIMERHSSSKGHI